jgi:hypothetical protein
MLFSETLQDNLPTAHKHILKQSITGRVALNAWELRYSHFKLGWYAVYQNDTKKS